MKRSGCLLLTVLGLCLAVGTAQAAPIAITNAGFESPALEVGGFTFGEIPGWSVAYGNAGIIEASGNYSQGGYSGSNVAWCSLPSDSQSGLFGQTVGTAQANTRYTLTLKVGDRDLAAFDTNLPNVIHAHLYCGSFLTPVSSDTLLPVNGGFATWTKVYEIPAGSNLVGGALSIYLGGDGHGQVQFDDVALDVSPIPEPMTAILLIGGIGGLVLRRRK